MTRPSPDAHVPSLSAAEAGERFLEMLGHPEGASRGYIYRNYDSDVQGRTVFRPGDSDAGVIAPIPGSPVGLAVSVDGNPYRGTHDPVQAGAWAVAGAVRNVACTGARPLAISDCLNFGNPERPETFWQFTEAVRGIAETASALGDGDTVLPVITGNVSFYNQSKGGDAIPPSPIVGCVGVIDDVRNAVDIAVKEPGHALVWAGRADRRLGGTLFARIAGFDAARPEVDVALEKALVDTLHELASGGTLHAAHDVSEGGLLGALFDMVNPGEVEVPRGIDVDLAPIVEAAGEGESSVLLFGEGAQVIVEISSADASRVVDAFRARGVPAASIGAVTDTRGLRVGGVGGETLTVDLEQATRVFNEGLKTWLR